MLGLFRDELHEHQLPVTQQREAVARALFESGERLSADDVTAKLRAEGERAGKATVYRTLRLLVRVGLATEHDFDEGFKRYEAHIGQEPHDHLICTACGTVSRIEREELDRLEADVARQYSFQVLRRQLKLYGLCARCEAPGRASGGRLAAESGPIGAAGRSAGTQRASTR